MGNVDDTEDASGKRESGAEESTEESSGRGDSSGGDGGEILDGDVKDEFYLLDNRLDMDDGAVGFGDVG